jgi:hypothetical protein
MFPVVRPMRLDYGDYPRYQAKIRRYHYLLEAMAELNAQIEELRKELFSRET